MNPRTNNAVQQSAAEFQLRDVTSTARLFNFNRPVYMTDAVWNDCVELMDQSGRTIDELAVLQRLRHVLFMASSALHGRVNDLECEFRVHRVPNDATNTRHPEAITLKLKAYTDEHNRPVISIIHPDE